MGKIHDVVVKKLITHSDDRGYFREILRDDDNMLRQFGQTAITKTYPGVIKAFHWHKRQWDVWFIVSGMAQVVLYDLRERKLIPLPGLNSEARDRHPALSQE